MSGAGRGLWILGAAALAGLVFVVADILHGGGGVSKKRKSHAEMVEALASVLHEDWRTPRRRPATGDYEPRLKATKDAAWIAAHAGQTDVDIANTPYQDLPSEWQAENRASAEVAIAVVGDALARGQSLDAGFVEAASAVIHTRWVERNGAWATPEQKLPYQDLSVEEKEKDRLIVRAAIALIRP